MTIVPPVETSTLPIAPALQDTTAPASQNLFEHSALNATTLPHGASPADLGGTTRRVARADLRPRDRDADGRPGADAVHQRDDDAHQGSMKTLRHFPAVGRGLALALMVLALQACSVDLYTNLDEREANEMVAILISKGIPASRVLQKDGKLTVTVDEDQFAQAVSALNAAGLPKEKFATLGTVFKQEGLVASPVQERAQMIYALSEELSRTVSEIDGVLSARVHVVLPDNDPLQRNAIPASASVFIRHEADLDVNPLIPRIKTLVANSISGLSYEKVSVVAVASQRSSEPPPATELTSFLGIWMLPSSVAKARLIFGGLVGALAAALGGLGYLFWRRQSRRRKIYPLQPYGPAK